MSVTELPDPPIAFLLGGDAEWLLCIADLVNTHGVSCTIDKVGADRMNAIANRIRELIAVAPEQPQ